MNKDRIIKFEPKLFVPPEYEQYLSKNKEKPLSYQKNESIIELTSRYQAAKATIGDIVESALGINYLVTEKGWVKTP